MGLSKPARRSYTTYRTNLALGSVTNDFLVEFCADCPPLFYSADCVAGGLKAWPFFALIDYQYAMASLVKVLFLLLPRRPAARAEAALPSPVEVPRPASPRSR